MEKELQIAIKKAKQGLEEGFNVIYSKTYNFVYFRAMKIVKNEVDTWDVLQEVYIAAFKSISQLKNDDYLYGWLGGITYNLANKSFRKKREFLVNEDEEDIFELIEMNDKDLQPEQAIEDKATSRIIKDLIEELPELQQAALLAYYFDEMSVGDIAEKFECSTGTIKSRLNYARKYLKEAIEQKERKEGFALHSISIPVLLFAIRYMVAENTAAASGAEIAYTSICYTLGLKATSIAIGTAATQTAAQTPAQSMASQATVGQASTSMKGVGATLQGAEKVKVSTGIISKIAALSVGAKVTVGVVSLAVITASGIGVHSYLQNNKDNRVVESLEPTTVPSEAPTPIVDATPAPVLLSPSPTPATPSPEPTSVLPIEPTQAPTLTPIPTYAVSSALKSLADKLKDEINDKGIITVDMVNNGEADKGGILYADVLDKDTEEPKLLIIGVDYVERYDWGSYSFYYSKVFYPNKQLPKQSGFSKSYEKANIDPDNTDKGEVAFYLDTDKKMIKAEHLTYDIYTNEQEEYSWTDYVDSWLIQSYEEDQYSEDHALCYIERSGYNRDESMNGYYYAPPEKLVELWEFPLGVDSKYKTTEAEFTSSTQNPGTLLFNTIGEGKIELVDNNMLKDTMAYLNLE